jgi:hypothetical protein
MADDEAREHNVMVAIFSVAAGMIGVCLTGIGLLHVANAMRQITTLADEFLAVDAILFLGCCLTAFLSFRLHHPVAQRRLRKAADAMFFFGLLLMVVSCALITSTFL